MRVRRGGGVTAPAAAAAAAWVGEAIEERGSHVRLETAKQISPVSC